MIELRMDGWWMEFYDCFCENKKAQKNDKNIWRALTLLLYGLASCGEKTREEMIVREWK